MVFRRFLPAVVCCFLLLSARAQQDTLCVRGGDTLRYRYTPLPATAPAAETQQQPKRKDNFWSRIFHGNVDRTFEKKIDFSFIGAPNYSKEASVGIGVLASGLYRVDRTDSLTPPSDVSFFGNFSLSGFYMFGVSGNTLFNHNRSRVIYEVSFGSKPLEFWGIGYEAGRFNQSADYIRKQVKFDAGYLYEVWRHLYVGGSVLFSHTKGTDFDDWGIDYLAGQKLHYTLSGIGMTLQYDSRDFIPAPERGTFLMVKQVIYPKGLGNSGKTLQDHRYGRLLPASVARRRAGHGYFRRIQQFGNAVVHAGGAGRRLPDARVLSGTLYRQQHPFLPDRVPSAYLAAHRLRRVGRCGQCLFVVRTFPLGSDAAQLRAGSALGVQTPRERAYRLRFRPQDQRFGFQY